MNKTLIIDSFKGLDAAIRLSERDHNALRDVLARLQELKFLVFDLPRACRVLEVACARPGWNAQASAEFDELARMAAPKGIQVIS